MPPSEFWQTDTWTVLDAYEGYAMSKGVKSETKLTGDDIKELQEMMEAEESRMTARAGKA